jgi:hypothetical protein
VGLLKHLLFWPVTGPTYLARFSMEKVEGAVRTELTDDSSVKRDLMELQMRLELGDIDDDQYVEEEARIMARLRQVRHWREQFGMATAGGLVRVAEDARVDDSEDPDDPDAADETEDDDKRPSVARPEQAEVDFVLGFDDED